MGGFEADKWIQQKQQLKGDKFEKLKARAE